MNSLSPQKAVLLRATLLVLCAYSICANAQRTLSYEVLQELPHHSESFTQGLYLSGDSLYESSGIYGRSYIQKYDAQSNEINHERKLPGNLFAEGLTLFNNRIYLLTWKAGVALVLEPDTLNPIKQLRYDGEGWGITHDGKHLITSDGSHQIRYRNPQTLAVVRTIDVHNSWRRYKHINELEFADGAIWANVWQQDIILKISPKDGSVLGVLNLTPLRKQNLSHQKTKSIEQVLNGIAYDNTKNAFWVTGKFWPKRYLIKIHSGER